MHYMYKCLNQRIFMFKNRQCVCSSKLAWTGGTTDMGKLLEFVEGRRRCWGRGASA